MKRLITSLSIALFTVVTSAQIDSLERQIMNYGDTKSVIISRGRNLLLDKFLENDISKVKEIKDFLIEKVEDENYIALYPPEYWLILYWTGEYEELANIIVTYDRKAEKSFYEGKIRPPEDLLYQKLEAKSRENSVRIMSQVSLAELTPETRDFLILNFKNMTGDTHENIYLQDTINTQADNFIKTYPESRYNGFTREFIRYRLTPAKWGMATEFFSGYAICTGNLSDNYTNNVPIGVAFDICYNRFELFLRDYIGFNKTKKDLFYSTGTFPKGSRVTVYLPEASLGYAVVENNRYKISPFAGIGMTDISPSENDLDAIPELDEVSLEFSATYFLGINLDIKLGPKTYPAFAPKTEYGFVRIRYAYSFPQFEKKYDGVSGNMHYITIGCGVFGRKHKREY